MRSTIKWFGLIVLLVCILVVSACQVFAGPTAEALPTRMVNKNPTRTLAPSSTPLPTQAARSTPTIMPTLAITPSGPASCTVAPVLPVVDYKENQLIPDTTADDWIDGASSARLTIIEYSDFQCKICATLAMNLRQLQTLYPNDVRVIFRYLPLTEEHDKADLADQAAEAAGLQGKFWEMHDMLFTRQDEWMSLSVKEFSAWLTAQAPSLKLDGVQFTKDLYSDAIVKKVFESTKTSALTTLTTPPALFFNKSIYQDWVDLSSLSNMVEYYKLPDRAFNQCPVMATDPTKQYTVTFKTNYGDIVIELYPKQAPMAVNNFIFLTNKKWYDNSTFFRVIPGYLVQGGDPSGSGNGRPGYAFTNEITPELRFDQPGMLAMSNYGDGTNGSQFFITYAAIPEFDGKYTIFGKVTNGMDVLESLRPRDPYRDQILLPADTLISVTIEEK
jgi:cyclophilin family peptidyl-prolyl cis-trans isomerase/protein-disulfide isomerase